MARPIQTFNGFAGQQEIIRSLKSHTNGITSKGAVMCNVGLYGSSGHGKSMLARAIASELQVNFLDFYCSASVKRWQLARHFSKAKKGDVIFLDECHLLPGHIQTLIYRACDSWEIPVVDENNRIQENEFQKCEPFCLILATDMPSLLNVALKRRIVLDYVLREYSQNELRLIISNYASQMNMLLSPSAVTRLAGAAKGVPRKARHLLESVKACLPETDSPITKTQVSKHLAVQGIDKNNLCRQDRDLLAALARNGSHMSLSSLAIILGTDEPTVSHTIEPYLIQQGWLLKEPRGRVLSELGKKMVSERGLK